MPKAQHEVASALNYDVFKAKEASAVGGAVCITYLATVKPIRAKLLPLQLNALGASKTAALPVAGDTNDEPTTDDAPSGSPSVACLLARTTTAAWGARACTWGKCSGRIVSATC